MLKRRPTFLSLDRELRTRLAEYVLLCRRRDRNLEKEVGWLSQSRDLIKYLYCLGIIPSYLKALLDLKTSQKEVVECLEVGVGEAKFIQQLIELYGNKIRFEGIRLSFSPDIRLPNFRQRIGLMESITLNKHYDFVFSVRGGFVYSLNSFAAVQEALNALKVGGMAFIEDGKLLLPQEWFRNYLKTKGFEVEITRYNKGLPQSFKFVRREDKDVEFSAFQKRYFEKMMQNREVFLEWGFDRVRENSPLTTLFSSLYSQEHYSDLMQK